MRNDVHKLCVARRFFLRRTLPGRQACICLPMKSRPVLWLLLSHLSHPDVPVVAPTLAWMAGEMGAWFELYLECRRDGRLFAETGSTVLGGHHHQQFNYLCAAFDVRILRLGPTSVFDSSIETFGLPVIAEADEAAGLYFRLLQLPGAARPGSVVLLPSGDVRVGSGRLPLAPFLFPEILYRRALGYRAAQAGAAARLARKHAISKAHAVFLDGRELRAARKGFPRLQQVDRVGAKDTWGTLTLRTARRWKSEARGLVFGDPPAVLSQMAAHCRHRRVAVFAPAVFPRGAGVAVSDYVEGRSSIATEAAALAVELGNRVITGRQTCDGDIFEWSRQGVCIQIIDPNRPAFPVVETVRHPWAGTPAEKKAGNEPSDDQLARWADEGRVLTSLIFHSGEVAHNEAMLALVDFAVSQNLKFGLGVHAARYETCPQMWELLGVPVERGGALGLVEPLLHSGGLGVLAECHCPPEILREHCERALARIREIAGPAGTPRGYYAFMDSNLDRLDSVRGDLFSAITAAGLDYVVSSALPGRNRLLWRSADGRRIALNQSPRVVHAASPFVRATTPEDLDTAGGAAGAGWILATLDAPVISFAPYIWEKGARFTALVARLREGHRVNVTPRTIARYARLLARRGLLPAPLVRDNQSVVFS